MVGPTRTLRSMRGIISYGAYVPYRRLDRGEISSVMGSGGGSGTRAVASHDEDTTTMGVEAARLALRDAPVEGVDSLWFATTDPAYVDKTNATTLHAALRLDSTTAALDFGAAVRSGVGSLRAALAGSGQVLAVSSDIRTGLPTGADESAGGDGAAAFLVGGGGDAPVLAEFLGSGVATEEFVDRWRRPGESHSRTWEERFGETRYLPLADLAWNEALKAAGVSAAQIDVAVVAGVHGRSVKRLSGRLEVQRVADDLATTIGNAGAADAGLQLAALLDTGEPGQVVALVVLADGVEVLVFRLTDAVQHFRRSRPLATQIESGGPVSYGQFLRWRGMLDVQPPNRPEPARTSSSAAVRREEWKYGFVRSKGEISGTLHLPPARVSIDPADPIDAMVPAPMADAMATIVTFTVDRLVYSVSPPVIFAVVDFDGGGRMPVELTDVSPDDVEIDGRVEMTFRRLSTSDGIHNYFWKARPVRA
jgi:hydroxymethylglutaryl-CoA synthase